ncbi:MAG: hypothetical protein Kow0068_26670 [Marinilabiliales bacterium]
MFFIILMSLSIILQIFSAVVAVSLIKKSKYNISWVLLSFALIFMSIRRVIELLTFLHDNNQFSEINLNNIIGVIISIIIAIAMVYVKKIFIFLRKIDTLRNESEKKILSAIIRTEENERNRFSKDLHDGLGPLLSSIKMALFSVDKTKLDKDNSELIDICKNAINQSIKSIKEISNNLSPHILENFGIISAINDFTKKISSDILIEINSDLDNTRFKYNIEIVLYRIICELINNTIKHASAQKINIDIYLENDILNCYYFDNGIGCDINKLSDNNVGMGLSNIKSRLKSVNGTIEIESSKNNGMHVYIKIPINN